MGMRKGQSSVPLRTALLTEGVDLLKPEKISLVAMLDRFHSPQDHICQCMYPTPIHPEGETVVYLMPRKFGTLDTMRSMNSFALKERGGGRERGRERDCVFA